jgi:hypothetical protein
MKIATRLAALGALALALGLLAPLSAQASTTRASATITLKVHADVGPPGTATLHITAGDKITVTASGCITGSGCAQYGYQGASPCGPGYPTTTPDGAEYLGGVYCGTVPAGGDAPMPKEPVGLLIGRTDLGGGVYTDWFVIAASRTWTANNDGTLDLEYNDSIYSDNTGYYTATVTDTP